MDNRVANDPEAITRAELDALIRTRLMLARAYHEAADAARAVHDAGPADPARAWVRSVERRAQRRVAELEQAMIARGWWTEKQRTVLPTDDGELVVRGPGSSTSA